MKPEHFDGRVVAAASDLAEAKGTDVVVHALDSLKWRNMQAARNVAAVIMSTLKEKRWWLWSARPSVHPR